MGSFLSCIQVSGETQNQSVFQAAFPNLTFNQPDGLFHDPADASRLYAMEQAGTIKAFNINKNTNTTTNFLDITDRVLYGGEQGLLGLAFHPNFSQNHYFYVDYVADNPRRTVIARFTAIGDVADLNSQQTVLEINQPYSNHKGGQLAFGPDGYLYIGVGDGGSEGDPDGNGQNRATLLGKILRVNIDAASAGRNYGIPNDNPFVGNTAGYREEIYAYGLRNPWRFSFDSTTGKLWVGDVGQDRLEEIDVVNKGQNYGWNIMEGTLCYNPASGCNQTGLVLPVWNYSHSLGNAIIGGYVYHGSAMPNLQGAYIYGDYGSGRIWALTTDGSTVNNSQLANTGFNIASFGVDAQNELYFTAYHGKIYTLTGPVIPEFPLATPIWFVLALLVLVTLAATLAWKRIGVERFLPLCRHA